jgi:hypothetical protein
MLHRRPPSTSAVPTFSAAPSSPIPPPSNRNKAYTPLRRQSSNLYGTPPGQMKPRYNLPSPSPGLSVHTGYNSNQVFPFPTPHQGNYGAFEGQGDWKDTSLSLFRTNVDYSRRGFNDALRMDRSWGLVWSDRELRTLVIKSTCVTVWTLLRGTS